jgi:hypothetical protein
LKVDEIIESLLGRVFEKFFFWNIVEDAQRRLNGFEKVLNAS